ncbi:isochorismatase family protein [Candidatus Gottesmanbacteria bacterium]|nr:isochorismatase family protein [Candidatus Gottesmanbacteria bacterium]
MLLFKGINPSNTGLLVIDVINSCADESCEIKKWNITFSKIRTMVPKLKAFIITYRETINTNIFLTNTVPWQKEFVKDNINELYEDERVIYYTEDRTGFAEKFYALSPTATDTVVTKNTNDVFSNKEFVSELSARGIKYLITTGIFSDGCVLSSVMSGFSLGFNFVVLRDLVETTDSENRQKIQKLLLHFTFPCLCARVGSSEDFSKSWKLKLNK